MGSGARLGGIHGSCVTGFVWLLIALSIGGCTSAPEAFKSVTPPTVRLGPIIELMNVHKRDLGGLQAIAMPDGGIHVFLAVSGDKQVFDLLVRPDGSVERHTIGLRNTEGVTFLDGAFDAAGKLHALIGRDHLVLETDGWRNSWVTPWSAAGIKDVEARFVPGAPNLTWCFQVNGGDVGAPVRWDWAGFAAGPGAIIFPWPVHGSRAVVVSETKDGFGPWIVLDPEGKEDTVAGGVASDARGNVSVAYERSRPSFIFPPMFPELYYARIPAEMLQGGESTAPNSSPGRPGRTLMLAFSRGHKAVPLGTSLKGKALEDHPYYPIAVDPRSGVALIYPSVVATGDTLGGPRRYFNGPKIDDTFALDYGSRSSSFAPAGGDRFHSVVQMAGGESEGYVQYRLFSHGAWSLPVELDQRKPSLLSDWHAAWPVVVATSDGAAVAVWRSKDAVVAQWIWAGD